MNFHRRYVLGPKIAPEGARRRIKIIIQLLPLVACPVEKFTKDRKMHNTKSTIHSKTGMAEHF